MSTTEERSEVATENAAETNEKSSGDAKTEVKGQKRPAEVNSEDSKKSKKDHTEKANGEDKEVNDEEGDGEEAEGDDDDDDVPEGEEYDDEAGEGEGDDDEEGDGGDDVDDDDDDA